MDVVEQVNNGQHRSTYKDRKIGRYPVLAVLNRFYYKCTSKESVIGIFH